MTWSYEWYSVIEFIDRKPSSLLQGDIEPSAFEGRIEFSNVSFAYPSQPNKLVIQGLSLQAQPGQLIAIFGPNGCGKSTLFKLLFRLYKVESGEILIDSRPID